MNSASPCPDNTPSRHRQSARATTPRNSASILSGGNFVPDNTAIPLSDIFKGVSAETNLYIEGVNPSDPNPTTITVKIDPTGDCASGDNTVSDKVNVTIASLQLVYTDVTGISHANPTQAFTANMDSNRITPNQQPDGIAADWQNGVDDGSLPLVRAVGSQSLENLVAQNKITLDFGELFAGASGGGIQGMPSDNRDGILLSLTDESQWTGNMSSDSELEGIKTQLGQNVESAIGLGSLDVLGTEFYQPPAEFLPQGESSTAFYRQIHVGVALNYAGSGTYASVTLYSDGGTSGSDTELAQYQFNDINPSNTTVYWVGLAVSYSETVTLTLNDYTLTGPLGSAPWNDGLFQELNQSVIGKLDSGDSYVPGS